MDENIKNTVLNAENILSRLRELKPSLMTRYRVKEIGLFGSVIHGEQQPGSDIDLLVEFTPEADLFDLIGLNLFLEDEFGCPVDVVPRKALREELKDLVLEQVVEV